MAGGVMGLLFIAVGVAVIAGAAMLISGRWRDGLPEVPPDAARPSHVVPDDVAVGSLTADALDEVRLEQELRGYRMADVDALIERLAAEIQVRDEEIGRLRDEEIGRLRDEDIGRLRDGGGPPAAPRAD